MGTGDNLFFLIALCTGGSVLLIASFIIIFVRHQRKILQQQGRLHEEQLLHQLALTRAIIESQETERKRIGQDLHDDVGTALSSLRLTIEMMDESDPGGLPGFRQHCKRQIDNTIHQVRHISHHLSPQNIELYGFMGAIEDLCETITQTGALQISLTNQCLDHFNERSSIEQISVYRVIEELLNNTIKHAGATSVELSFIHRNEQPVITYRDNGQKGFDPVAAKRGMGLHNMESRLGIIGATYHFAQTGEKGFGMNIFLKNK